MTAFDTIQLLLAAFFIGSVGVLLIYCAVSYSHRKHTILWKRDAYGRPVRKASRLRTFLFRCGLLSYDRKDD